MKNISNIKNIPAENIYDGKMEGWTSVPNSELPFSDN